MTRARWVLVLVICGCTAAAPPPVATSSSKQARSSRLYCEQASDCTIVPRTCCGHCGGAAPGDAVVLNAAWASEHAAPWPRCEGTGCPRCHAEPDPRLIATCEAHRCALLDLSRHAVARCRDDSDCTIERAACCDCQSGWVGVRADSLPAYRRLVCEDVTAACACPPPPPVLRARCVERRCVASPGPSALGIGP